MDKSLFGILLILFLQHGLAVAANDCSPSFVEDVLEKATSSKRSIKIDCNLSLKSSDVVTKALDFFGPKASGLTLNCNGATLDGSSGKPNHKRDLITVRPQRSGDTWKPPENIKIKNCKIKGSVRTWWGDQRNTGGDELKAASRKADFTSFARALAPKNIHFDNITFEAQGGGNVVYFGTGNTNSAITNSKFLGSTSGGAIYLESESGNILIKNNIFDIQTRSRELISVDASSNNSIINNTFRKLQNGGIFLYRNCGEKGVIRHTSPDENNIVNNVFDYSDIGGSRGSVMDPAIFVSSRNGGKKYCGHDKGYPYGSSADDSSPSRNNVIAENRVIAIETSRTIRVADQPNFQKDNEMLASLSSVTARKAGCYVKNGMPKDFIESGKSVDSFKVKGKETCTGKKVTCEDGVSETSTFTCPTGKKPDPKVDSKNDPKTDPKKDPKTDPKKDPKTDPKTKADKDPKVKDDKGKEDPKTDPKKSVKNVCYVKININKRLVVRSQDGTGLAYYGPNDVKNANRKLSELIKDKVCDSSSKPYETKKEEDKDPKTSGKNVCYVELNRKNRIVVRNQDGTGISYFPHYQGSAANYALSNLISDGTCDPSSKPYVLPKGPSATR